MCLLIIINDGEIEIETPAEMKKHFGMTNNDLCMEHGYNHIDDHACLCQVAVEESLHDFGIAYTKEYGDIFVEID